MKWRNLNSTNCCLYKWHNGIFNDDNESMNISWHLLAIIYNWTKYKNKLPNDDDYIVKMIEPLFGFSAVDREFRTGKTIGYHKKKNFKKLGS